MLTPLIGAWGSFGFSAKIGGASSVFTVTPAPGCQRGRPLMPYLGRQAWKMSVSKLVQFYLRNETVPKCAQFYFDITHWSRHNDRHCADDIFKFIFQWKLLYLCWNFTVFVPKGDINNNGLAPKDIWASDDTVYIRICASLGLNRLKRLCRVYDSHLEYFLNLHLYSGDERIDINVSWRWIKVSTYWR